MTKELYIDSLEFQNKGNLSEFRTNIKKYFYTHHKSGASQCQALPARKLKKKKSVKNLGRQIQNDMYIYI